ncbi:MAG TPA: hypothetical protein QF428_01175 [Flavobacteriaceae bacterium]|jgi:hypothetical protein|nr:hypothetical protein [Flavobacteriaceae bacterium]MDP7183510.1 hypothetical protein [Flavobacteriaceae bacterium]HJO70323.1 hypothetical protein [Flavobacteriaceae bacterium]|tara:strand:- start:4566 stop:4937 length:372 start_codon:yes stop_codon:yes gene_type:complete
MIKRLFILFLLTSCYSVERDCENFKMGEFEFSYKLNDTIQRSLFTRTLDYEIEEFNSVIDSSSISWVNDCEFVLTKVNPKTNQEKRPVRIKIIRTYENSYDFEYSSVNEPIIIKRGTVIRIKG